MKYFDLLKIDKLIFGIEDISYSLGISIDAAKVSAVRYVKKGILLRVKKNMYLLKEKWKILDINEKFTLANFIQTPSYISLMTALDYYEITTQIQQNFFESIVQKRTKQVIVENAIFSYTRINKNLYFGFIKKDDFFIAEPEKAFLDTIYLTSIGRYNFDRDSLDINKLNRNVVLNLLIRYPRTVKNFVNKYEYI